MKQGQSLAADELRRVCDPSLFIAEASELRGDPPVGLGQERAMEALRLGLAMPQPGYNVFVLGDSGTGRRAVVQRLLQQLAQQGAAVPDLCYVQNFANPLQPQLLSLPVGSGAEFCAHMRCFACDLGLNIEAMFGSGVWHHPVEAGGEEEVTHKAATHSEALPLRTRCDVIRRARRAAVGALLSSLLETLRLRYTSLAAAMSFFNALEQHLLDVIANWGEAMTADSARFAAAMTDVLRCCQAVPLVSNKADAARPVIIESNPSLHSLFGYKPRHSGGDGLLPPLDLIRGGALHRALGGYLVVYAQDLQAQPQAWRALKQALKQGEIRLPASACGDENASSVLEPQAVRASLKLVLIGEYRFFHDHYEHDSDMADLFRIVAEFDDEMVRSDENVQAYAQLLAAIGRRDKLLAFGHFAVAKLVEYSARLAEDATKLSLKTGRLRELMCEADYVARAAGRQWVDGEHIEQAISAARRRLGRYADRQLDAMARGTTLVSTSGLCCGQVNGLVVVELGGQYYGHPLRITATACAGDGGVIDIERETELGAAIHSKGVMILSAFLAARFARLAPLSLSASLVLEQSYEQIDGDSASMAELCALLSALARLPIRQGLAITGSVNQFGEVQAVGSINEKVEGFFDLCVRRGFDGGQGVIIPSACVSQLMLREDVVAAVKRGIFSLYCIETVDDAMGLLTGQEMGVADARGILPPASISQRIAQTLETMAAACHTESAGRGRSPRSPKSV